MRLGKYIANPQSTPNTVPDAPTVGKGGNPAIQRKASWVRAAVVRLVKSRPANRLMPITRSTSSPNMYGAHMLKHRCHQLPCMKPEVSNCQISNDGTSGSVPPSGHSAKK